MTFISIQFIFFVAATLIAFYIAPLRARWAVLLIASMVFYFISCREAFYILLATIVISFFMGKLISSCQGGSKRKQRLILTLSVVLVALPLFVIKEGNFILSRFNMPALGLIVPMGVSFYTLQIISYLVDIYRSKISPEQNIFRYALYVSYFPQIIQGPIPRFNELAEQLQVKHSLDEETFVKGFQLILWGFFLKLVIADKAAVIVDTVFGSPYEYRGTSVIVAGILYSIQLYADFLACTSIAKGVSELFGISLSENFDHPYFSQSISEFWRRWHISLSSWLRDYIYIPLGGNRKGTIRKYINLIAVFVVSGMWHGSGYKYIFWGLMHAGYQIAGAITKPLREKLFRLLGLKENGAVKLLRMAFTFFCVMLAWIIFRANTLYEGVLMILSIFTVFNPQILFNGVLLSLGLSWKELCVLAAAILVLVIVSLCQEKYCIRDKIMQRNLAVRVLIYLAVIVVTFVLGTYGFGFSAKDFIYGGF